MYPFCPLVFDGLLNLWINIVTSDVDRHAAILFELCSNNNMARLSLTVNFFFFFWLKLMVYVDLTFNLEQSQFCPWQLKNFNKS